MVEALTIIAGIKQFGLAPDGSDLRDLEAVLADRERQIAELRAERDKANTWAKEQHADAYRYAVRVAAAEAENARLKALPLKDEVERVLEPFARADRAIGDEPGPFRFETRNGYRLIERDDLRAARALLSRLRAGEQDRDGLSEWAGWDKSRDPWSETKHKDAVLEALFRGPWSVEDAAAMIGFIDRTWTKRPASPSVSEGGSRP